MNRPVARLWAGALVLGAVNQLHSAPVRLSAEPDETPLHREIVFPGTVFASPQSPAEVPALVDPWPQGPTMQSRVAAGGRFSRNVTVQSTLAIPLPPAVLSAGATIGIFAIAAVFQKRRRSRAI